MKKVVPFGVGVMFLAALLSFSSCAGVSSDVYDEVVEERDLARVEASSLQTQLDTANATIAALQIEVSDLQATCPPKQFPSGEALQTWLHNDDISERGISSDAVVWYARGLELQKRAAEDGYIISVDLTEVESGYYVVTCLAAVEDGGLWWWDPETDEVYYWLDIKHF